MRSLADAEREAEASAAVGGGASIGIWTTQCMNTCGFGQAARKRRLHATRASRVETRRQVRCIFRRVDAKKPPRRAANLHVLSFGCGERI